MGTNLLPPRNCLNSHPSRYRQPLSHTIGPSGMLPRTKKKPLHASAPIVIPSLLSDSAAAAAVAVTPSHQSEGLLPRPVRKIDTGHIPLCRRSFVSSRSSSAPVASTSLYLLAPANPSYCYSSNSKSLYSRFPSVAPNVHNLSSNDKVSMARHPFKLVQANRLPNKSERQTRSSLDENVQVGYFPDTIGIRKGVDCTNRKFINGIDSVGDIKKRTNGDFPCRECSGEGEYLVPLRKDVDMNGGKRRQAEKASIRRNASETKSISKTLPVASSPAVSILQKPKNTKGAADELLARSECKLKACISVCEQADIGRFEKGGDNLPSFQQKYSFPTSGSDVEIPSQLCKNMVEFQEDSTDLPLHTAPAPVDEKWAGPTYSSISPPPSCLPLPKFSLRQLKTSSMDMSASKQENMSADPGQGGFLLASRSLLCQPVSCGDKREIDLLFATKDLRRILNLDPC